MDAVRWIFALLVISFIGLQSETFAEHVLPHQDDKKCLDGWIYVHRFCYNFKKVRKNQRLSLSGARASCKEMGGELVSFLSMNEKIFVGEYLKANYKRDSWWVDLSKVENEWRWGADQSAVIEKITPWKNAGIKNRDGNPCGYILIDKKQKKLVLSNSKCSNQKNYICQQQKCQATTNPPTERPTTVVSTQSNNVVSTQESQVSENTKISKISNSEQDVSKSIEQTQEKNKYASRITPTLPTSSSSSSSSTTTKKNSQEKAEQTPKPNLQNVTPFTYPPKTKSKSSTRIVTMKTGSDTPLILTPPARTTEGTTPTTQVHTTPEEFTPSTTHSQGFRVKTPRVTRSTSGVSLSPFLTSTLDDSNDDENDPDDVTSFSEFPRETTTIRREPPVTYVSDGSRPATSFATSTKDTNDDNDDDDDGSDGDDTDATKTTTNRVDSTRTSPLPTRLSTKRITIKPIRSRRRNRQYWLEAREEFEGCYIPGVRATVRQAVLAARRLYKDDTDHCPQVTISRYAFPRIAAGESAAVQCRRGTGFVTLECGEENVCWLDQPDLSGCASPRFKAMLKKIKEQQIVSIVNPSKVEEADMEESVNMTSELVSMTETEDISMEDILVTSEVLTAFTHTTDDKKVKRKDKKAVMKIVHNVLKAGNNLLSRKKKRMWKKMQKEDKVRSATSLMVAMETATMSLAEKIEEPTVIKRVEENVEMEIQVVDVEQMEKEHKEEIVYQTGQSDNSFSIPVENLKSISGGNLDKVVFITHYSMADILDTNKMDEWAEPEDESISRDQTIFGGRNDTNVTGGEQTVNKEQDTGEEEEEEEEDPAPQIASYILSASIGGAEGHKIKLAKPVTFTMRHTVEIRHGYRTFCSFWDVSQGSSQAFWSQEGCSVKKTNNSHTTCECDHMTSFAILLDVHGIEMSSFHQSFLRIITIIGCVISCFCLIVSWITFQFCTALQGERNSIHKNLAACLFVSELLFVTGVTQTEHKIVCSVIAVFLHFFFLASFTWMFLEGLHIIFMLVQVFDASRSRLPYYYITGYGFPAVVVGISCGVYFPGYGTDSFCWLTTDRSFIWAFAGPVAVILLVNAIFLTYAMTTVCRHSDYVFNAKDRGAGSPIRSWIQGALALEVLLGLTWMFGYFLLNANTLPLAYAFTILNSLQGMFIFIFHCLLNKKARKEYCRFMRMSLGRWATASSSQSTFGKRTNGSTKSHEMVNSSSNSRKLSMSYKHNNNANHNSHNDSTKLPPANGSVIASIDNNTNEKDVV